MFGPTEHLIYMGHNGKMVKVNEPKGNPQSPNFVIKYKDKDWSGFRSLEECEAQFAEIEAKLGRVEYFEVVER